MPNKTTAYQFLERTQPTGSATVEITVVEQDCLIVAQSIKEQQGSVCVLNLANQFDVGGDYLSLSACAQEESLN